jgi:hypothetical protein
MVYTRFGNEVSVDYYDPETGIVGVTRESDGKEFDGHISDLRADGGDNEIIAAASAEMERTREIARKAIGLRNTAGREPGEEER